MISVQPEHIVVRIAHRHPLRAEIVILRAVPHAGCRCGDRRIAHLIRRREVERVPHPGQRRREGVRPRAARGQSLPASLTLLVDQLAPVQPGPRIAGAQTQGHAGTVGPAVTVVDLDAAAGRDVVHPDAEALTSIE